MIKLKKTFLYCPSKDRSHKFENCSDFLKHIIACPILNGLTLQTCKKLTENRYLNSFIKIGHEKSCLRYFMCPKNFLHLQVATEKFKTEKFCKCSGKENLIFQNNQGFIEIGPNNTEDYLKYIYQIDYPEFQKVDEESIVCQDLEKARNSFLKGQALKNSIYQNRMLYFNFQDELYLHAVQFKFINEGLGMKQFMKKYVQIDQHFEILPQSQVIVLNDELRSLKQSQMQKRLIMELQLTQRNSYKVQKAFNNKKFCCCVKYNDDILYMFKQNTYYHSNSDSMFLIQLDKSDYMNLVEMKNQKLLRSSQNQQRASASNIQETLFQQQNNCQQLEFKQHLLQNQIAFKQEQILQKEEGIDQFKMIDYSPQFNIVELSNNIEQNCFIKDEKQDIQMEANSTDLKCELNGEKQNQAAGKQKLIEKQKSLNKNAQTQNKIISKITFYKKKESVNSQEIIGLKSNLDLVYKKYLLSVDRLNRLQSYKHNLEEELNFIEK